MQVDVEPGAAPTETSDWRDLKRSLLRVAFLLFFGAEVAMVAVESIFVSIGGSSFANFAVNFLIYTAIILLLMSGSYYYIKNAWMRTFASERHLLSIEDISSEAVYSTRMPGIITGWSKGAERIFGYSRKEAIGKSVAILLPDDFLERDLLAIDKLVDEGVINDHRTLQKRKNGKLFAAEVSATLLKSKDGQADGFLAVLRDITDQLEMEERLKESEERYRELYESSADGILAFNMDYRILECNQTFATMLGYDDPSKLESLKFTDITPAEWHVVDSDIIENQLKKSGFSDEYVKEFRMKDGTVFPAAVRAWSIPGLDREMTGVWSIVRDISEQKRYESFIRETIIRLDEANEQLKKIDQLKTEFVAMVTHELRAPLGAIESSLSALRAVPSNISPDDAGKLLDVLDRGVKRLSTLVDDLLDITRIESGQLKLKLATVDAAELAATVANSYEPMFAEKGLSLKVDRPDIPCPMKLDSERIEQVMVNILDNALKFTQSGDVTLSVEYDPKHVTYSISDSGPGIPVELHQEVFKKFYSLESQNPESEGIGLGLAISKGIVEEHGGRIWVESRKKGGSTFYVDLPCEPDETED